MDIETTDLRKLIYQIVADGHVFSGTVIKRSTGELREMNCRLGVTKHLQGGELGYNAKAKDLVIVYDLKAKGYRSVALEGVRELRGAGQVWKINT